MINTKFLAPIFSLLLTEESNFTYFLNGYTQKATDYKASLLRPASPKHVLATTDEINFEFTGKPHTSNYYLATVQSSVSESPLSFYLVESGTPGVYRNPLPLRLAETDALDETYYLIKFKDEERLTTVISIPEGTSVLESSILLDRGEFASCGISIFFSDATQVYDAMTELSWANAGYQEFNDSAGSVADPDHLPMQNFVKNGGLDLASYGEADFLHVTSHGDYDGHLYDQDSPAGLDIILRPTDIDLEYDLNQDVEWLFLNACDALNHAETGRDAWMDILTGSPHPLHGLLGFDEAVSADLSVQISSFFARLGATTSPETYLEAFFNAMTDGFFDEPCAMAVHEENINDTLKILTQDSTNNSYRYYWYDVYGFGEHPTEEVLIKTTQGTTLRSQVDLAALAPPVLQPIVLRPTDFAPAPEEYAETTYSGGLVVLDRKSARLGEEAQEPNAALRGAQEELQRVFGLLPEDAQEPEIGILKMQRLTISSATTHSEPAVEIARTIRYSHYLNHIPVVGDILAATISGDTVLKLRGNWHQPVSVKSLATADAGKTPEPLMTAQAAVEYALSGMGSGNKGTIKDEEELLLEQAELCYYGLQDTAEGSKTYRPTYRFRFREKNRRKDIYIDAVSGAMHPAKEVSEAMRRIRSS
nr:DUF6345 domain-containing protein [uncultured Desulfobulbus sp.]